MAGALWAEICAGMAHIGLPLPPAAPGSRHPVSANPPPVPPPPTALPVDGPAHEATLASAADPSRPKVGVPRPGSLSEGDAALAEPPRKKPRDKRSLDYIVRSLVAGGVAGSVAKTVIAPLDRVKILFQTSNPRFQKHIGTFTGFFHAMQEIHQENGVRGLFQGHSATLLRIFPYAAIKFMAFEQYKHWLMPTHADETSLRHLAAGSLAGVTSVYFTYPLELVRVRMAFSTGKRPVTVAGTVRRIYAEPNTAVALWSTRYRDLLVAEAAGVPPGASMVVAGAGGAGAAAVAPSAAFAAVVKPVAGMYNFYRGFLPTMYGMIPYAGISFWTYETVSNLLRAYLPRWSLASPEEAARLAARSRRRAAPGKAPLSTSAQLAAGALAGAFSQTCSYPLEVVRRRMQVAGSTELRELRSQLAAAAGAGAQGGLGDIRHMSTAQTAREIWRTKGPGGFFVGLSIGYIKVTPMVAVSFVVYEKMKVVLDIE